MPQSSHDDANYIALGASAVAAGALTYYMTKRDPPIDPLYDFDNQSVEIDSVDHIRVLTSQKDKPFTDHRQSDVRTLFDVLPKGLEVSGNGPCLGTRDGPGKGPYSWITYSEVLERVRYIGSGLINKGIESSNLTHIGIYSSNRVEWVVSEHACYSFSFPVVSLYDSYGKDSIKYILNHAEIQVVFVDTYERMLNIMSNLNECPSVKMIIHFNQLSSNELGKLKALDQTESVEIISYKDLMNCGRENIVSPKPPKPSDIATICYTSGTTGMPKGAIISHGNIICAELAVHSATIRPHLGINDEDVVHMSYLPYAHMMERQATCNAFISGAKVGMISGDVTTLLDDVKTLRPTDMPFVPRLLNRFYNMVMSQVKGNPIKYALMKRAIAAKEADRLKGIYRKNTIYDKLVFNKIRDAFGGRLRMSATGSAPVSEEVLIFNKAAFSIPIPEGYGQTEATCAITFTHPLDPSLGHCGPPVVNMMVKLVDVPEMNYFADKNQGEICAKGPSLFQGYLKDEQKTRETVDSDGWLHTGDIGQWLPNGTLKIIDRKKNLFKLSQGEYISPEKIESVYARSPLVAQIIVEGSTLKDYTVAIMVPEPVFFMDYFKKLNFNGSLEELCKNKKVRTIVVEELNKLGKEAGLMKYEQIKNVYLNPEMFSTVNNLATPTMKIKRLACRQVFKETILELYNEFDNIKRAKL